MIRTKLYGVEADDDDGRHRDFTLDACGHAQECAGCPWPSGNRAMCGSCASAPPTRCAVDADAHASSVKSRCLPESPMNPCPDLSPCETFAIAGIPAIVAVQGDEALYTLYKSSERER